MIPAKRSGFSRGGYANGFPAMVDFTTYGSNTLVDAIR